MVSVGNKKGSSLVPHKVLFCFATYTLCVVYSCTKLYQNIHYNLRNLLKIPSESINIYQQKGAGQSCLLQDEGIVCRTSNQVQSETRKQKGQIFILSTTEVKKRIIPSSGPQKQVPELHSARKNCTFVVDQSTVGTNIFY